MLLGYSRAMYVEFVERCTLEIFMDCHIRAFNHLGGVPAEVLYDNMKNVVIGRQKASLASMSSSSTSPTTTVHSTRLPSVQSLGEGEGRAAHGLHP